MPAEARIILDARKLNDYGIGTYTRGLARALQSFVPEFRYEALVPMGAIPDDALPRQWKLNPVPHGSYSVGEYFLLGRAVGKSGCDLFHATHYTVPRDPGLPVFVTIHDLIHILFPKIFGRVKRLYAHRMIAHAVSVSRIVNTPSSVTRDALIDRFHVPADRVRVIPLGVDDVFRVAGRRIELADAFRRRVKIPEPFLLFAGNPKPHKGVDVLIRAFRGLRTAHNDLSLVFVGGTDADIHGLRELVTQNALTGRVRFLGRTSLEDVIGAYAAAEALVLPSLYEGFGLPVLEAMAVGTPAVCSNAGALPETVGDAAILFESGNADALAHALDRILNDGTLRTQCIEKGLRRVDGFRWEATARRTAACYAEILGASS